MRTRNPLPAASRIRGIATTVALTAALALTAGPASATPDETADAVMQLLAERHLVDTVAAEPSAASAPAEPGLLRKVQARSSAMVEAALDFVGVRYRRGGATAETGFDCSGFTRRVFETSIGMILPHRADEQASAPGLVAVKREDLRPGDLVFFNTLKRTFSHVGIYIGNDQFVHAPRAGKTVRTDDLNFAYWAHRFTGARRAVAAKIDPTSARLGNAGE